MEVIEEYKTSRDANGRIIKGEWRVVPILRRRAANDKWEDYLSPDELTSTWSLESRIQWIRDSEGKRVSPERCLERFVLRVHSGMGRRSVPMTPDEYVDPTFVANWCHQYDGGLLPSFCCDSDGHLTTRFLDSLKMMTLLYVFDAANEILRTNQSATGSPFLHPFRHHHRIRSLASNFAVFRASHLNPETPASSLPLVRVYRCCHGNEGDNRCGFTSPSHYMVIRHMLERHFCRIYICQSPGCPDNDITRVTNDFVLFAKHIGKFHSVFPELEPAPKPKPSTSKKSKKSSQPKVAVKKWTKAAWNNHIRDLALFRDPSYADPST